MATVNGFFTAFRIAYFGLVGVQRTLPGLVRALARDDQ